MTKRMACLSGAIAILAVGGCGVKHGREPSDPDYRRDRAVELGRHGGAGDFTELAKLCLEDPDALVRAQAASALGRFRTAEVTPVLLRAATDPSPLVRRDVAEAMGEAGDRTAVPVLLRMAESAAGESPSIRRAAVTSLGTIADASAVDGLIELLGDSDPHVRHAAHLALERCTGQMLPAEASAWREWRKGPPAAEGN